MRSPKADRPLGATVLAILLGWLAVAGFGNAIVWRGVSARVAAPENTPLAEVLAITGSPLSSALALAYGVTALVACIGIWRMHSWMVYAYKSWIVAVGALFVWMSFVLPSSIILGGRAAVLGFGAALVALLTVVLPYLHRLAERTRVLRSNNTLERSREP